MPSFRLTAVEEKDIIHDEKVDVKNYVAGDIENVNVSLRCNNKSFLSLAYSKPRGLSIGHKRYRIIFEQEHDSERYLYIFFKTDEFPTARRAFKRLDIILEPMLSTGAFLPRDLLQEIILPEPLPLDNVGPHLVEKMEKSPGTHLEWLDVIQALLNASGRVADPEASTGISSTEAKLAFFKKKFSELPKSHPVHETVTAVNIEFLTAATPFIAVPQAASKVYQEDDEVSERVWNKFRRGTLKKFDSEEVDDNTKTWLIDAVEKQYLKSAVKLTLSGVGVNDQHSSTGDSALHIAVRHGNVILVKLLLAYKADPTVPNAEDETAISIAENLTCKSGDEIRKMLKEMAKLQEKQRLYYAGHTEVPEKRNSSDTFLLSLDGGGMKSVIMCRILQAIEARMNELCDSQCKPLQSYFDYIAGTSAGAIVASLLLFPKLPVRMTGMYLYKFMIEVFGAPTSERAEKLKDFVVDIVGEDTTLSQLEEGNVLIMSTIADISPNKLHIMSNYGASRSGKPGPTRRKVWEALLASSAAPTYFPAFESFLDGGLMANNPTLPAMTDIFKRGKVESRPIQLGLVLSLGTGYTIPVPVENFEVFVPGFTIDVAKKLFQSSMGLVNLLSHFASQTTQSNGECVSQATYWCESIGTPYFRFSPPVEEEVAPDMNSIEELVSLLYMTQLYVLREHKEIDRLAKVILSK